jgi:hypothetical protein
MSNDFETLETYWSMEEAQINKNLLESEGVRCFLAGEATSAILWNLSNATGGVRLQVPQSDLDRAELILQAARKNSDDADFRRDVGGPANDRSLADNLGSEAEIAHAESADDAEFDHQAYDAEDELDESHSPSLLEKLRSFRRLILLPFLIGPALAVVVLAIALFMILASFFARR